MRLRTRTSRGLSAVVGVLSMALLVGCGGAADRQPGADDDVADQGHPTFTGAAPGGMLVVLEEGEPDELNPLTYESRPANQVVHLVFRSLARRDSTLSNYEPYLLASWEQPDPLTAVLHVQPGLRWHDGEPVTAEDVAFTIERQRQEEVASPRQADVAAVQSVEVVDSLTLRVRLSEPGPYALNALLEVVPVPRHLMEGIAPGEMRMHAFGRQPVGNGLFRFERWQRGQQIVLVANEDAPEGRPALDRIVIRVVPEASTRLTELLSGAGDLMMLSADQRERAEGAQGVSVHAAPRVRPAWIAWNVDRAPMNDVRVRRAALMAVHREQIAQAFFGELGEASFSPIPPALWEASEDVQPIPYDPAGARRLLEEAGWRDESGDGILQRGGQPLRLEIEYFGADPIRRDVLVAMQNQLGQVGIQLVPRAYERSTWVDRLRGRQFQGSFWGWGWGPAVAGPNAQMVFHSRSIPPGGANFAGYSNPQVDALLDRVLVETDTAQARGLWRQIEQHLIDDAVYAPIFLDPELYVVNERFGNVQFRGPEWWEDVIFWHIPTNRRLPRDRVGAGGGG
jgi:peptide/nickel transport system substrate-binding protein